MKLKESYIAMNGDYEDVMLRLPREASVIKFLRKFAENGEFAELKEAAKAKDYKRVFELSHDLKGMAANLSISRLGGLVSAICEETRDKEPGADFDKMIEEADAEYINVIKVISEIEE